MLDQTYIITKDDLAIHFEQVVHKKKFQFSVLKLANKKVFHELFEAMVVLTYKYHFY